MQIGLDVDKYPLARFETCIAMPTSRAKATIFTAQRFTDLHNIYDLLLRYRDCPPEISRRSRKAKRCSIPFSIDDDGHWSAHLSGIIKK